MLEHSQKDPVWWAENILGVQLWDGQKKILTALANSEKVTISSGHAMGKDFLGGVVVLWYLYNFQPSIVITTAPSDRQVDKVIWGEIQRLYANSRTPLGGRMLAREIQIDDKWYAIGFTTKETNQSVGKFQGFHGANVLVLMTEAQAIEDIIFEEVDSLLISNNSKLYLAGNPLRGDGKFYESFLDQTFSKFIFSCYDAPNVKANKELIPGMVTRKWVTDKEKRWGKESPLFQARVLGQFPRQSMNSLISLAAIRESFSLDNPARGWKVLAIDPARYGSDESAFVYMEGGVVKLVEGHYGKATTETEGRVISLIKRYRPDYVVIDEGALGAGIVDHIEEQTPILHAQGYKFELVAFKFGGKATNSLFYNAGTEAYFKVCAMVEQGKIRMFDDDYLTAQLSARRYKFYRTGGMILESKEDIKKRGMPSPDRADAFVMAAYTAVDEDYDDHADRKRKVEDGDEMVDIFEIEIDPLTGYRTNTN